VLLLASAVVLALVWADGRDLGDGALLSAKLSPAQTQQPSAAPGGSKVKSTWLAQHSQADPAV
jgi:hypothetical protein